MAVQAIGRVLDHSKQQGSDRLTLVVIANNCNREGVAWAGMATMAEAMGGISRRAMITRIQALAMTTELMVFPRSHGSHHYIPTVNMPLSELRKALKWLAKERKTTIHELIVLRRQYARDARVAIEKAKEAARQRKASGVKSGVKPTSQGVISPLHTIRKEPEEPTTEIPNGISRAVAAEPLKWQERVRLMGEALCKGAHLDFAIHRNRKRSYQVAASLLKADYNPEDVPRFSKLWFEREFPGGKRDRQPPSLDSIEKYIGWVREQPAVPPVKQYDTPEADYTPPIPFPEKIMTPEEIQAKADRELWESVYRALKGQMPAGAFAPVNSARFIERQGDMYIFEVSNAQDYEKLCSFHRRKFADNFEVLAGRDIEVVFTLADVKAAA